MRFQVISLRKVSVPLEVPFQLLELTELNEYTCFLYRCEGAVPLHRHLDHDELLWPQDKDIFLAGEVKKIVVEAGKLVRIPRGWKHASMSRVPAYVLLISRRKRSRSLNGHYQKRLPQPPQVVAPETLLDDIGDNMPLLMLSCDTLRLYAERVFRTGPVRRAEHDVLIVPIKGSVGVRCGGIVVVAQETELVRVPANCGWHLFGEATVVWMTPQEIRE
ncbi:MAG: hypothetical protein ACPGWR_23140 [Ardenticatenaceae bacterium]